MLANMSSKSLGFYLVFLVITSVGVYLRLDQFTLQVLLDDEWHVIHRLLVKTPKELFQSWFERNWDALAHDARRHFDFGVIPTLRP